MPRRGSPDPLAKQIGKRIRQLRTERGLTSEKLAYESGLAKGHLSDIEHGLVCATVVTLKTLADGLDVFLLDLVNFPTTTGRAKLIEVTRLMPQSAIAALVEAAEGKRTDALEHDAGRRESSVHRRR